MSCPKECGICLDNISNTIHSVFSTSCDHHFHNKCITQWLLFNHNCPICRKEFYNNKQNIENIENLRIRCTYFTDTDCDMSEQTKLYMMNSIEESILRLHDEFKEQDIDIDLNEKITNKNKYSSEIIYFTIKKIFNNSYFIIFTDRDIKLNYKIKFNIHKNKNKFNKKFNKKINSSYNPPRNRRTKCKVLSF